MTEAMHPVADHLPPFITAPGDTDYLLVAAAVSLIIFVLMLGSLYFRLHSLPERIAHGTSQLQFQLVAVLTLLALFTHNTVFWFSALLLAIVPIPDFWTPLATMSESLAKMAARGLHTPSTQEPSEMAPEVVMADENKEMPSPTAPLDDHHRA